MMELKQATLEHAQSIAQLEALCFPEDEAASLETITLRLTVASKFFKMIVDNENQLIGFINGTCIEGEEIHHDSMTSHVTTGKTLVIHSVSIHPSKRRQGLARKMLRLYVQELLHATELNCVLLLSKSDLLQLYLNCGFVVRKQSDVVHGKDIWFELGISLFEARRIDQHTIDGFTKTPFQGNPAGVVYLEPYHSQAHCSSEWMQNVAKENNYAETAFVSKSRGLDDDQASNLYEYDIRWFTPTKEIALCGHATLAACHYLLTTAKVPPGQTITFRTFLGAGSLTAMSASDGSGMIELDFPSSYPKQIDAAPHLPALCAAFPLLTQDDIMFAGWTEQGDLFLEITPECMHRLLHADIIHARLKEIGGRGVSISCIGAMKHGPPGNAADPSSPVSNNSYDFVSRFFVPNFGVDEDPVTGSAHCALAPYYQSRLFGNPDGNSERRRDNSEHVMVGYQASKRGGEVTVRCAGDRVKLSGFCVTTVKSKLQ